MTAILPMIILQTTGSRWNLFMAFNKNVKNLVSNLKFSFNSGKHRAIGAILSRDFLHSWSFNPTVCTWPYVLADDNVMCTFR